MVHSSYLKGEEPRQLLEKRMREDVALQGRGLVEAPLTLTWTQMTALPRVEIVTLCSIEGPQIPDRVAS